MIIHLHQLIFFCHHGLHEEEKITGNKFIVNLDAEISELQGQVTAIGQTANYVAIYSIVKNTMMHPTALLETLAIEIAEKVLSDFSLVTKVSVSISKQSAPISNFQGLVGISYSKTR